MRVKREPKNFEQEDWVYFVVGYHDGKAIMKNEEGELFFLECEENVAPEGTYVPDSIEVTPVEILTEQEQKEIWEFYG